MTLLKTLSVMAALSMAPAVAIAVSPIPLPPAALLFLSGLAGMGLLARRRRAKLGGAAA